MPVFSLKEARSLQVQNVSENTFKYWGESATYGYYGGGYSSPPAVFYADVLRLDHSNETASNPGNSLFGGTGTHQVAAVSNNSYGYFGGGWISPSFSPTVRNLISRLDFTNETVSDSRNNLPVERRGMSGVSGSLYGYYAGGTGPGGGFSTITRLDFSSETLSAPGKNLPVDFTWFGPTQKMSTSLYGYFNGGTVPGSPGSTSQISRLDFSTENISLPGKNLPPTQHASGLFNNSYYGYFYGAGSNITRIDLSTESLNDPGTNFPPTKDSSTINAASTSTSYGYIAGGYNESKIARLDFSNESISLSGKNLPQARYNSVGVSAGQSIYRGKGFKTYGYLGGAVNPPTSNIYRLDFSNLLWSTANYDPSSAPLSGFVSNNYYLYYAGGSTTSNIRRLDFSNESMNTIGNLPSAGSSLSKGINSSKYGYFVGNIVSTYSSYIYRFDFSNEVLSDTGNTSPTRGRHMQNFSTNQYGYTMGSYYNANPGDRWITNINRLDFSNETISLPGGNVPTSADNRGIIQNNIEGQYAGGNFPYISLRRKFNFSTETTSSLPSIPASRSSMGGIEDTAGYGYFCGGTQFTPPPYSVSTVNRIDFSTSSIASSTGVPIPISSLSGSPN